MMEYVLTVILLIWIASLTLGVPLWDKYTDWVIRNFGKKEDKNG